MGIKFTQYLMPRGEKQEQWIDTPELADVQEKADAIIAAGLKFEMEMLSDYRTCSFTITGMDYHPDIMEEMDLAQELAPNGPPVIDAIKKLVNEFDLESYLIMKDEQTDAT